VLDALGRELVTDCYSEDLRGVSFRVARTESMRLSPARGPTMGPRGPPNVQIGLIF